MDVRIWIWESSTEAERWRRTRSSIGKWGDGNISLTLSCLIDSSIVYFIRMCMYVSQGRKKHTARPGLEPRTSRIPCEHSDDWATEPHGRPVTISPCLIRLVPESDQNHAGTDETVPLLLAAPARTHTEPPNVTGEEKAHGPTGTRTQDLLQTVRALWPQSYRATRSTCDMYILHKTGAVGGEQSWCQNCQF